MTGVLSGLGKRGTEYTVSYSDMGGVNFSPEEGEAKKRYAVLENMYRDYEGGGGALETVPGFRRIKATTGKVHSLFSQKSSTGEDFVIVHSRDCLYRFPLSDKTPELLVPIGMIADTKSAAYASGADLYILDGKIITKISDEGEALRLGSEGAKPYIPTTYTNGVEREQINLLSELFREEYTLSSSEDVAYASPSLQYRISDPERKLCAVFGLDESFVGGPVYIPSYALIGDEKYRVVEICDGAFSKKHITTLHINEGLIKIGCAAFLDCTGISEVYTPDSLAEIEADAFSGCLNLKTFYLGCGIGKIGEGAFKNCPTLEKIHYASTKGKLEDTDGYAELGEREIVEGARDGKITVKIPIYTPTSQITEVTADGEAVDFWQLDTGGGFTGIILHESDKRRLDGKEIKMLGILDYENLNSGARLPRSHTYVHHSRIAKSAILGCTLAESFDGRIFLSGNPEFPNTVFYSERDSGGENHPLYFGAYNYFCDGVGAHPVISMLAVADSLAVFKAHDDGGGSIFYHKPKETGTPLIPKVYPASYIHSGICAVGPSLSFFDDPVFISERGVSALACQAINSERAVVERSHNINARLLCENLSEVSLGKWCGYLVVAAGEHFYLGDSRATFRHKTGSTEYEWYYLSGIGTYRGEWQVYRYASSAHAGYDVMVGMEDKKYEGTPSLDASGDVPIYYCEEGGKKYEIYPTEEWEGGDFYPATAILSSDEDLLLFGTECGDVCIFNNDMKGKAPERISSKEGFDPEEWALMNSGRIHPDFYDFASHTIKCTAATAKDSSGAFALEKNTVKNSLVIKCRVGGSVGGGITLSAKTDGGAFSTVANLPCEPLDFSDMSFISPSFSESERVSVSAPEKEKRWLEKEVSVECSEFRTPIRLYSLSYAFTVKGRLKNKS